MYGESNPKRTTVEQDIFSLCSGDEVIRVTIDGEVYALTGLEAQWLRDQLDAEVRPTPVDKKMVFTQPELPVGCACAQP